jgi:phosphatidylserine/phosphatidylglycerophosphate/cardiolipin synthase-like enzyme
MALKSLSELDKYKAAPFPPGYPDGTRTFYSPVDQIHEALTALLTSANKSLIVAMYGYDDKQLNTVIKSKLQDEKIYVQMSLDSTQAAGKAESTLLAPWLNNKIGNSIAIGHSEKSAIMHMKMVIIDGVDVVTGSTNWSTGGEEKQDNQLTVIRDPLVCAEARSRIDIIHDTMLKQMAAKAAQGAGQMAAKPARGAGRAPAKARLAAAVR